METKLVRNALAVAGIGAGLFGAYTKGFTPWQRGWGATRAEQEKPFPGDDLVMEPNFLTTRAITIDAAPEDLFPWLVQMGKGRGGLYSYDFLDRLFGFLDAPSAKEIVPGWQDLEAGDVIHLGRGADFPVALLEKDRWMVLANQADGYAWSWAMLLEPTPDGRLRFLTRNRANGMKSRIGMAILDLAAFIMVRRWLMVLKQRAEMTARRRRETTVDWEELEKEIAQPVA